MAEYWKVMVVGLVALTLLGGCTVADKTNAGELADEGLDLEREGRLDQAIEKYSQAIELEPQSLGFRLMRANGFMGKGDYDSAIKDYTEVIQQFPQYGANGYFERGRAYKAKGDNEHAIADFEKATSMSSDSTFIERAQQEIERLR